jgi:hypothetical protein
LGGGSGSGNSSGGEALGGGSILGGGSDSGNSSGGEALGGSGSGNSSGESSSSGGSTRRWRIARRPSTNQGFAISGPLSPSWRFPHSATATGFAVNHGTIVLMVFNPDGPDAFEPLKPESPYIIFLVQLAAEAARCRQQPKDTAAPPHDGVIDLTPDVLIDLTLPSSAPAEALVDKVLKAAAKALERATKTSKSGSFNLGSFIKARQFCWRSEGEEKASCLVSLLLLCVVLGNSEMFMWFCASGWTVRRKNRTDPDAQKVNDAWIINVAKFLIEAARLFTLDDDDDDDDDDVAPAKPTKRGRGSAGGDGDGDGNEVHKRGR